MPSLSAPRTPLPGWCLRREPKPSRSRSPADPGHRAQAAREGASPRLLRSRDFLSPDRLCTAPVLGEMEGCCQGVNHQPARPAAGEMSASCGVLGDAHADLHRAPASSAAPSPLWTPAPRGLPCGLPSPPSSCSVTGALRPPCGAQAPQPRWPCRPGWNPCPGTRQGRGGCTFLSLRTPS